MEWTQTLDQQRTSGVPPGAVISEPQSVDGTVRLGGRMVALGLVRLGAALLNYATISREQAWPGGFSLEHWLQFLMERPPVLLLIAFWPVVLGLALYRTGWPELLKAAALTFLVLTASGALSFVADWGHGRTTIDLGSFRLPRAAGASAWFWPMALLGGAQILGEALIAVWASVLVWKGPLAAPRVPDFTGAARRWWIGVLALAVSLACLSAPPRLPVWSAYTGLLKKSTLLRDLVLKGDARQDRHRHHAPGDGAREHRALDQNLSRARYAWESERYVEAHEEYEHLMAEMEKLPPAKPDAGWQRAAVALNGYAWLLATCPEVQLRDAARAVGAARRALELGPENGAIWNTLGVAYYRLGNWDEARNALYRSMELTDDGDSRDWFFLAMIYAKLNNPERARGWYDRASDAARELEPGNAELYRFQVEAAEVLGLPKPKRVAAPPGRGPMYRRMFPRGAGPPPRGVGGMAPHGGPEGGVSPFRSPRRGMHHFVGPDLEIRLRRAPSPRNLD